MDQAPTGDMPMGDASSVPPAPQDAPAPGVQDIPEDPTEGTDVEPTSDNPKIQNIVDNLNKLGSKGVDTADKYVQSLVDTANDDESENGDMPSEDPSMSGDMTGGAPAPAPMAETYQLTKKQIREMHEAGLPVQGELEKENPIKKTDKKKGAVTKKEYNSPKFR